jgi:hypothetical protein
MDRDVQSPLEDSIRNNPQPTAANNKREQFDAGASGSAMPNPWGGNSNSTSTASNNNTNNDAFQNDSASPASSANPLAALSGLSTASSNNNNNPWAQGATGAAGAANPFAAMMGGMPGGMPQPGRKLLHQIR